MALVLDVPLDRILVQSDRGHEISPFPQRALRELLGLFLDPCGGFAFDQRNGIRNRVFGRNGDVQMNMFIPDMPCFQGKSLPSADQLENTLEFLFNVLIGQHLSAIPGCPDHVVFADPSAVAELVQSSICHGKEAVPSVARRVR